MEHTDIARLPLFTKMIVTEGSTRHHCWKTAPNRWRGRTADLLWDDAQVADMVHSGAARFPHHDQVTVLGENTLLVLDGQVYNVEGFVTEWTTDNLVNGVRERTVKVVLKSGIPEKVKS